MAFASSIASCSVEKRKTGATGPKVSSRAIIIAGVVPGRARSARRTCRRARGGRRRPSRSRRRASASATCSSTFATAASSISGPWSTPSSKPWPTRRALTAAENRSTNASWIPSCTRIRLAQTHVWPMLRNFEAIAPSTATSRSASSKTISGALPPSSSEHLLHRARALRHQLLADLGRAGERQLADRRVGRELVADHRRRARARRRRRRPGARPARASSASASAESGVALAGFSTIVQPAASAGPALRGIIAIGKFHGVIAAQTPIGCLSTNRRRSGDVLRDRLAVDALGLLGEPLDERGAVEDLAARLGERLALLRGQDRCEVVGGLDDQVEPAAHDRGALLGGLRGPGGQRCRSRRRSPGACPRASRSRRPRSPCRSAGSTTSKRASSDAATHAPATKRSARRSPGSVRRSTRLAGSGETGARRASSNVRRPRGKPQCEQSTQAVGYSKASSRRPRAPSSTSIPSPGASGMRARPSTAAGVPVAMRSAAISLGR